MSNSYNKQYPLNISNVSNFNSDQQRNRNDFNKQNVNNFTNQNQTYMIPNNPMNANPNVVNNQNQRANNQLNNLVVIPKNESAEFIKTIEDILQKPHSEERTENLGEVIFYFLLDFIPKFKLNVTQGQYDDTILCSKLTGILIHEDDQEILDIVSNTDNLLMFIRNVVMV